MLIVISISSQYLIIKLPFILIQLDKYEKVNIEYVKLNELQNTTNSIESQLYFSYARFDDRRGKFSSTNVADVTLTADINKQCLYEKNLENKKTEYIKMPSSLTGYRMIFFIYIL